jgi:hypothetical protein
MTEDVLDEQQSLMISRDRGRLTLIQFDPADMDAAGCSIDEQVWNAILPIALADNPRRLGELTTLDFGDNDGEAPQVRIDGHILSVFKLAAILEDVPAIGHAVEIARGWTRMPLEMRERWRHQSTCGKAVHAQLRGLMAPTAGRLDSKVPRELISLIKASRTREFLREDRGLHWAYAESLLGVSCIAWSPCARQGHGGCLAMSNCDVAFQRLDDPGLGLAIRAVEKLVDAQEAILDNPMLAAWSGWKGIGHEALELAAALESWRQRLVAAEKLAVERGLSTAEVWNLIDRDLPGQSAA